MLQDPENPYEEWQERVSAPNPDVALSRCEFVAKQFILTEVINISQETRRPSKAGDYLFICWFRAEVTDNDSSS